MRDDLGGGRGAEHLLGLPLELRLGQPDGDHRDQALERILDGHRLVAVLQQPGRAELVVQRADQGPLEPGDVGAAVRGGDDVDERADHAVVAAPPLQRHVDSELALHLGRRHVPAVIQHRDGLGEVPRPGQPQHVGDRLAGGQVRAELADAAVEAELGVAWLLVALVAVVVAFVADGDGQAGDQVGGLAGALGQGLEAELGVAQEHLAVRPEPDPRPGGLAQDAPEIAQSRPLGEVGRRAGPGELAGDAAAEAGRPGPALPVHLYVQPRGQRVDHRRAHAVQPAGGGVGAAAELAARVQPGHDQLHAGQLGLALDVDRDAPAIVPDLGRPVRVQDHVDPGAVPAQRLVHRVVEDLPQAVLQAAAVGRPDVHARALAHRVQALQHRQVPGGVGGVARGADGQPGGGGGGDRGGHGRAGLLPGSGPVPGPLEQSSVPGRVPGACHAAEPAEMHHPPAIGYMSARDTRCLCAAGSRPGGTRAPRVRAEK